MESHTVVDPDEDVKYGQLNYLILQVCLYYKYYDTRGWTSPLLTALENNEPLPTTTKGTMIPAAAPGKLSNYKVIDNLGNFGMDDYNTMEEVWKEVTRTTTVEVTPQTLESMRLSIRSGDIPAKSSRRSRL